MEEYMAIVDASDSVVGKATQDEVYANQHPYRIVHVFVIHPKTKKVYFQVRSEKKSYLPGYYCTSAAGHVRLGETYDEAAKRELAEELGLSSEIKFLTKLTYNEKDHLTFIGVYVSFTDDEISFADGEVSDGTFLDLDLAHTMVESGEKIHPHLGACFKWLYANLDAVTR